MTAGFGFAGRLGRSGGSRTVARVTTTSSRGRNSSTRTSTSGRTARTFPTALLSSQSRSLSSSRRVVVAGGGSTRSTRTSSRSRNAAVRTRRGTRGGRAVTALNTAQRATRGGTTVRVTPAGAATVAEPSLIGRPVSGLGTQGVTQSLIRNAAPGIISAVSRLGDQLIQPAGFSFLRGLRPRATLETFRKNRREPTRQELANERGEPPEPPEEGEIQNGPASMSLKEAEKPRILAVIEEDYKPNGTPTKLIIVAKKMISTRFKVIDYFLQKKSVFEDDDYSRGKKIPPSTVRNLPIRIQRVLKRNRVRLKMSSLMVFTDSDLLPGRVYSYKIKVNYEELPPTRTPVVVPGVERYAEQVARAANRIENGFIANQLGFRTDLAQSVVSRLDLGSRSKPTRSSRTSRTTVTSRVPIRR